MNKIEELKKEIEKVESKSNKGWFESKDWAKTEKYFYLQGKLKGRQDVLKELNKKIIKFQNEMEDEHPLRVNTAEEIRLIILEELNQVEQK